MTDLFFRAPRMGLPCVGDAVRAANAMADLHARSAAVEEAGLADWVRAITDEPPARRLLDGLFSNSPFLTQCALGDVAGLMQALTSGPDSAFTALIDRIKDDLAREPAQDRLMRELRLARRRAALIIAIADITGYWSLERVTHALSDLADASVSAAISHLLLRAAERGELVLADPHFPEDRCGYVTLAMGKHGARELNYSSDIDLIVLYDPAGVDYRGGRSLQQAFLRMTQQLVAILDQRTADGYVFRTDLRLRPDPGSTPIAIPCVAAQSYYASRGETWERAAMIKARAVAGDLALGRRFLTGLTPFIWRESMDFWMIRDFRAIKARINAHRGSGAIGVSGHNIKLGRGGIREIEFFAQTQQLIYGGADPYLRCLRTLDALTTLTEAGWLADRVADELTEAYEFLRQLEHRIQMVDDQQTQTLPADDAGIDRIARFMGFEDTADFNDILLHHLHRVEAHYSNLFEEVPQRIGVATLGLTGAAPSAGALETLQQTGFKDCAGAFERLRVWHRGELPASGDKRCREAIDRLIPDAIETVGRRSDPDGILAGLHGFLAGLPNASGCLTLLAANPPLLDLLADIAGAAPKLLALLTRRPALLQAALSADFFGQPPDARFLAAERSDLLRQGDGASIADRLAAWADLRRFQIAVNVLRHRIDSADAGRALRGLTDAIVGGVRADSALTRAAVAVAFGPYGTGDLTTGCGLDLMLVDDQVDDAAPTEAQTLAARLSASAQGGELSQLRFGSNPLVATGAPVMPLGALQSLDAKALGFRSLQALSQARIVSGSSPLAGQVSDAIRRLLVAEHDMPALAAEACGVAGVASIDGVSDPRRCRGGLGELELAVRMHQWRHAADHPDVLDPSIPGALARLGSSGVMPEPLVRQLIGAHRLLRQLESALAIAVEEPAVQTPPSDGLKSFLARAGGAGDIGSLEEAVANATRTVSSAFEVVVS